MAYDVICIRLFKYFQFNYLAQLYYDQIIDQSLKDALIQGIFVIHKAPIAEHYSSC